MADSDKDILITPQTSQVTDPSVVFSSGATGGDDITLFVTDDGTISTLSYEASSGQLFSISNDLTGIIFSVNDISGVPSIEVNADGTVSLAEFDGDVGIGNASPVHKLDITGPTTANTATGIFIDSTGDAYLDLRADNTVGGLETNNPYVRFRQDQDAIEAVIGFNNNADDALGNTFTGAGANAFTIHNTVASGTIAIGVNGAVGLTIDDSNIVTAVGGFSGSGASVTNVDALTLNTRTESSVAGNNTIVLRTASGYIYSNYINTTANVTVASATNIWVETGSDSFHRKQTPAQFITNHGIHLTATALAGDVTGAVGATVVGNDSHTHAFNNLTSKTGGTGNYTTTGDFTADNFEATGLGPNTTPGTDDAYFGGYGVLTSRATSYISNVGGAVALNHTGLHGVNTKLITAADGIDVTGDVGGTTIGGITQANLLDKTATETISGSYTHTAQSHNNDNVIVNFGTGDDFGIYFDIVDSTLRAIGASNDIKLMVNTSEVALRCIPDGAVELAHNGIVKLATTTSGVMITATAQATTFLSVTAGNGLYLYDSVKAAFGLGIDMTMYHNGTDNYIDSVLSTSTLYLRTNSTENAIACTPNAQVSLYHNAGLEFRTQQHENALNTSGCETYDHLGVLRDVGFNHVKEIAMTTGNITLDSTHAGTIIKRTGTSVVDINLSAGTEFPIGSMVTILNHGTAGSLSIDDLSDNLYIMDGSGTVVNSTGFFVAIGGCITIWRQALSNYYVWGAGIP